jgi:hypothetical protein
MNPKSKSPKRKPSQHGLKSHEVNSLDKSYSFDHAELTSEFLDVAQHINLDLAMAGKEYDLIIFREWCLRNHVEVRTPSIFHDDMSGPGTAEQHCLQEDILKWDTVPAYYSLSDILESTYPGCEWVIPNFVHSTFPAIFGHFTGTEYVITATRFLVSHIEDKLIDQLVGSFLSHCFLFRARFF